MDNLTDPKERPTRRRLVGMVIVTSSVLYGAVIVAHLSNPEFLENLCKALGQPFGLSPGAFSILLLTVLCLPVPLLFWTVGIAWFHAQKKYGKFPESLWPFVRYFFSSRFNHRKANACRLTIILCLTWYVLLVVCCAGFLGCSGP